MYWILMSERSDEYELSIDELPPTLETLGLRFDHGNHMPVTLPKIDIPYIQQPDEHKTDNIVAPTRLGLLINAKIKAIFDSLGINNIQYYDARLVESTSGATDESYMLANVVGKYACVDEAASKLEYFDDGEIEFIDELALELDEGADYGHIFRLAEFPPILIISNALKVQLEKNHITGFKVYKPEEFSL